MALVLVECFSGKFCYDRWVANPLSSSDALPAIVSGITGFSGFCADCSSNYVAACVDLGANYTEIYFGFRLRNSGTGGARFLNFLNSSNQGLASIGIDNWWGWLNIYRGNGTTWLARSTRNTNLTTGNTYFIEVYYKPADSGGRFVVKVDGVTCIDFTGDTTDYSGGIRKLSFGHCTGTSQPGIWFGDLVVDDANWPGVYYNKIIRPTGPGNSAQWTARPSGNNWSMVDEDIFNDGEDVSVNAVDQVDSYAGGDLPAEADSVPAVSLEARCVQNGASTPGHLGLLVRTGGTDYPSADKTLPTLPWMGRVQNIWATNPATLAAWTPSEVNAMELGCKSVT